MTRIANSRSGSNIHSGAIYPRLAIRASPPAAPSACAPGASAKSCTGILPLHSVELKMPTDELLRWRNEFPS